MTDLQCISVLTLSRCVAGSAPSAQPSSPSPLWTAVIPDRCTAACGIRTGVVVGGGDDSAGIVLAGCSDGSLHFLCMSSGMKAFATLSLGCSVVTITAVTGKSDVRISAQNYVLSQSADAAVHKQRFYCVATCADGEVYVWEVRVSASGAFEGPLLVYCTNVRGVIKSLRCAHPSNGTTDLQAHISDVLLVPLTPSGGELALICVADCRSAVGGDWHVYKYLPLTGCWSKLPDAKYLYSRWLIIEKIACANNRSFMYNRYFTVEPSENASISNSDPQSLSEFSRVLTSKSAISVRDVVIAARSGVSTDSRLGGSQPVLDTAQAGRSLSFMDWSSLISLCHVEAS